MANPSSGGLSLVASISPRSQFRRTFSIHNCAGHRDVSKLLPILGATQHQSTTAHVPTTNKVGGESQPLAKGFYQNVDVLACRNAAQKNNVTFNWQLVYQESCVALDRQSITPIVFVNVDSGEFTQVVEVNSRCGIDEAACRCNHKHTRSAAYRPGEGRCVGKLPAEVEAAQKREHLCD